MNLFEQQANEFIPRHIGPNDADTRKMLKKIGAESLGQLISNTVPPAIRMDHSLNIPAAMSEYEYLKHIKEISLKNKVFTNYIGQGYYDNIIPSVILRNIFEIGMQIIHSLPGGDFAGPFGKPVELSNDGQRPYSIANRQCFFIG